uniref:Uncharacterized protein n=2 Tax=Lutzomyia longipalpis TaxID=7200 RepID=A0A1B0CTL5_LUTLO
MKQLRMDMRSSLYDRTSEATHVHKFGPDSYNESDDTYTHTCLTCKYTETFEKMLSPETSSTKWIRSTNQFSV